MIPTDDEAAARSAMELAPHGRVRHFYDPQRSIGLAFTQDVFDAHTREALETMAADHPRRAELADWLASPASDRLVWDAALLFSAGARWSGGAPAPLAWSMQTDFRGDSDPVRSGVFWRNDARRPPVESDWSIQIRELLAAAAGG